MLKVVKLGKVTLPPGFKGITGWVGQCKCGCQVSTSEVEGPEDSLRPCPTVFCKEVIQLHPGVIA